MKRYRIIGGLVATGIAVAVGASIPALAVNATDRGTSAHDVSVRGAGSKVKIPAKASVKHKKWHQKHNSWCVPATFQLSLRTFGIKVTQDKLAKQMHTDDVGTTGKNAAPVYQDYVGRKGYVSEMKAEPDAATLMKVASYDVGVLHRAVLVGIDIKKAPWSKTHPEKRQPHAVSLRGYDRSRGTVTIWDPGNSINGGSHTVPVRDLETAASHKGVVFAVDTKTHAGG